MRLFKMSPPTIVEMSESRFDKEKTMQKIIEENIGVLFPGLKFLETEFRRMSKGQMRPDTIAFDTNRETFVTIEYKNVLNKEAVDQAKSYLEYMGQYEDALVLSHSKNMKCSPRDEHSFHWDEMYAIIIAPEFSTYQIAGARKNTDMELHKITIYDESMMLMERVGGGHEERPIPSDQTDSALPKQMDQLYKTISDRVLTEFPRATVSKKPKAYDGFTLPNADGYFCAIGGKRKIWLEYSGKRATQKLKPSKFVSVENRSVIKNDDDLNRAIAILKWLHENGKRPAEQA